MIRYNNYVIEANDYGGWVLSESRIRGQESKDAGKEYLIGICYPSSLKSCFKRIQEIEFAKMVKSNEYTIKEALIELEKITNKLIEELNKNVKEELE